MRGLRAQRDVAGPRARERIRRDGRRADAAAGVAALVSRTCRAVVEATAADAGTFGAGARPGQAVAVVTAAFACAPDPGRLEPTGGVR